MQIELAEILAAAKRFSERSTRNLRKARYFQDAPPERQAEYLAETSALACVPWAKRVLTMIHCRHAGELRDLIAVNPENRGSQREFERITGLKVGANFASREAAVRSWCGPENYDAMLRGRAALRAEEREREAAARRERILTRTRAEQVRYNGTETTVGEMIDQLVSRGFTLHYHRRGAVERGQMEHPDGTFLCLHNQDWSLVAQAALAAREAAGAKQAA